MAFVHLFTKTSTSSSTPRPQQASQLPAAIRSLFLQAEPEHGNDDMAAVIEALRS